jgi:lipopolysaccharide/colanic/teichoic acid biosynthesis glycosyltransferase
LAKRVFDIVFASVTLMFLSPLFLMVALLIKMDSPGPVLYVARRCGLNGRPFNFYKFRTMVDQADRLGSRMLTRAGDQRVTLIGKYLRLFKIDELPQLFNVLKGDMSVVGPRPEVYEVVEHYYVEEWSKVLKVRPGLTCTLQVEVFPDFTASHPEVQDPFRYYIENDLPHKLRRDSEYAERGSFWLDMKIIARTLYCILFKSWSFLGNGKSAPL